MKATCIVNDNSVGDDVLGSAGRKGQGSYGSQNMHRSISKVPEPCDKKPFRFLKHDIIAPNVKMIHKNKQKKWRLLSSSKFFLTGKVFGGFEQVEVKFANVVQLACSEEDSRGEKIALFGGFWTWFILIHRISDMATFIRYGVC